MEKPALSQISSFSIAARKDEHLKIFDWTNDEKLYQMTLKQYKYILFLWYSKQYFKLKEVLSQFLQITPNKA